MIDYILWVTRPNAGEKATGLEPHPCIVYRVGFTFCLVSREPLYVALDGIVLARTQGGGCL